MRVTLTVTGGPHRGRTFAFGEHDTFIVGRSPEAHFRLPLRDKTISRFHFLIEVNPPSCRLLDMASTNGTFVNGREVPAVDLKDGDVVEGGRTVIAVAIDEAAPPDSGPPPEGEAPSDSFLTRPEVLTSGGPADPPAAFDLPRYRVDRELGRGGMGVVYLARHASGGPPLALKTITPAVAGSDATLARFLREAAILRRLDHTHIVGFHEIGYDRGRFYIAMEYVPGPDAFELVRALGGPMPIGRAVDLACQALAGLAYAHALGFVHRDIKPNNLLVATEGGRDLAKLADFGLARIYQTSPLSGLTVLGQFGGTAGFLAPEQITNFRQAKPATDIYALGATLYFLLTAARPFNLSANVEQQLLMILQDDPIPIRSRRPEIPEGLANAIGRALERDPVFRFPDARAMLQAIATFRESR